MTDLPQRPSPAIAKRSTREPALSPDDVRLAAIDVGSNSLHMIVCRIDASGGMTLLSRSRELVGLGRMSFPSKRLSKMAMDRAKITLARFVTEAQRLQCEKIIAVATSAVREAENGGEFIEQVRRELKIHVRVVSAREEARLIFLGVRHGLDLSGGPHMILDIGGGSVEFIVASGDKAMLLESRKLGAARMTAKFVKSDPIDPKELQSLLAHYDRELTPLCADIAKHKPVSFIATSGAVENLASMCAAISSKDPAGVLRCATLGTLVDELIKSKTEDRAAMPGLDDKRRDQILAAALLVREVCKRLNVEQFNTCRSALREGILVDYLAKHRPEFEVRRKVPNPRRRAVLDLAIRCHWHREHADQVARLTCSLFDQLRPLHGMGNEERELIAYGATLHDIGALISRKAHHKHSMYLIMHGDLDPFTADEVRTIANIARYHRKSAPSREDAEFAALPKRYQQIVRVGAALLRIADGLDRTNTSVVQEVVCRTRPDRVDMLIESHGDAEMEIWSATSRAELFQEVFGRAASIRQA